MGSVVVVIDGVILVANADAATRCRISASVTVSTCGASAGLCSSASVMAAASERRELTVSCAAAGRLTAKHVVAASQDRPAPCSTIGPPYRWKVPVTLYVTGHDPVAEIVPVTVTVVLSELTWKVRSTAIVPLEPVK